MSKIDSEHLFNWDQYVFPIEGRIFNWAKPTQHIIARDGGVAVGHIGFGQFTVIGEVSRNVIGVGGVVVRPEHQGKNIPQKMFEMLNTTDTLNAQDTVKTLFCPTRLVSYYERHGYHDYSHSFEFMQETAYTTSSDFHFMLRGELGLSGAVKIPSLPW